jgi:hypothetical protein
MERKWKVLGGERWGKWWMEEGNWISSTGETKTANCTCLQRHLKVMLTGRFGPCSTGETKGKMWLGDVGRGRTAALHLGGRGRPQGRLEHLGSQTAE